MSRARISRRRQRGFTLVEIAVSLIMLGLVITISFQAFELFIKQRQENAMLAQEAAWRDILENVQGAYAAVIAEPAGVAVAPDSTAVTLTPAAVGSCGSPENRASVDGVMHLAGVDDALLNNPFGGTWCIVAAEVFSVTINALPVVLRPLAVFSSGGDDYFHSGTSFTLNLACPTADIADSKFLCDSGYFSAQNAIEKTHANLDSLAEKFSAYSRSRVIAHPNLEFVNHFVRATITSAAPNCNETISANPTYGFDRDGSIPPTDFTGDPFGISFADALVVPAFSGLQSAVGFSVDETLDGWGQPIWFDNASCAVRHAQNNDGALNSPPFSMRLVVFLPGGEIMQKFVFTHI